MPRYKNNTPTVYKDINGDVIKIGDCVKDSNGELWDINNFQQAVPRGDGMAVPMKKIHPDLCEIYDGSFESHIESIPDALAPEEPEEDKPIDPHAALAIAYAQLGADGILAAMVDHDLALELRRRGYTVKATKEVIQIIEV